MEAAVGLSLFEVSNRLGVSPSAVKKRVSSLDLPVLRGPRGKLIFDHQAFALLQRADDLLKAGHGFEACRRMLGLTPVGEAAVIVPEVMPGPPVPEPLFGTGPLPPEPLTRGPSTVLVPLARRRNLPRLAPRLEGPLLDAALALIIQKDGQQDALQARLNAAYDEIARLNAVATVAAERTHQLERQLEKLQGELRELTLHHMTQRAKPRWRLW